MINLRTMITLIKTTKVFQENFKLGKMPASIDKYIYFETKGKKLVGGKDGWVKAFSKDCFDANPRIKDKNQFYG